MNNQKFNHLQIFRILSDDFRDSGIPADRLFFLNSVKKLIGIGEKLNSLSPNDETQKRVQELKDNIKDYSLYPKLNPSI